MRALISPLSELEIFLVNENVTVMLPPSTPVFNVNPSLTLLVADASPKGSVAVNTWRIARVLLERPPYLLRESMDGVRDAFVIQSGRRRAVAVSAHPPKRPSAWK